MTAAIWVFRKTWHPNKRRLARLRALWWIVVRRHETEICGRCGGPVGVVFHVHDELWLRGCGFPDAPHGVLCPRCFDKLARQTGLRPNWECANGEFPTCTGSPCVHEKVMVTIAEERDGYWHELTARARLEELGE